VYTDDDVAHAKPEPAAAADGSTTEVNATGTDGQTGATAKKNPTEKEKPLTPAEQEAKKEADWRKRFRDQREKIARAEKELDVLQRETEKAQVQYYPDPQKALAEQYSRQDINDKDAKIAAKQQEVAQLKQGLADMEDALRAAGGDSGWAR
jgi:predicted RNase H-like nuclease (RuvC/YqgF family)